MKRKGFTLIELLAVVIILAVIALIVTPIVLNFIEESKEKAYLRQKEFIIDAAENYLFMKSNEITWQDNETEIYLQDIQEAGLIKNTISNPKGGNFDNLTKIKAVKLSDTEIHYDLLVPEELKYYFSKTSASANGAIGTYKYKNNSNYFTGSDPNNWLEFGQVSNGDTTPLLWRIIKVNDNGIKIIYEGAKNGISAPTENGRINQNAWDTTNSNKWERPATLKGDLNDWFNNLAGEITDYIAPINWCIGAVGEGTNVYSPLADFLMYECVDGSYDGGIFKGKTIDKTGIGMIKVSDYISTSSAETCTGSYQSVGNNHGRDCGKLADGTITNFLYKNYYWWTLIASATHPSNIWEVTSQGDLSNSFYFASRSGTISVRPVLNLKADIMYKDGDGSLENPYKIK